MTLPSKLTAEQLTCVIDSREQWPLDVSPLQTVKGTLPTADYTIQGLENFIAIERKNLDDLLGCCGRERERFEKEIQRLLGYPCRALVIETTWGDTTRHGS